MFAAAHNETTKNNSNKNERNEQTDIFQRSFKWNKWLFANVREIDATSIYGSKVRGSVSKTYVWPSNVQTMSTHKICKHFLIVIIEICVHVWISFVYSFVASFLRISSWLAVFVFLILVRWKCMALPNRGITTMNFACKRIYTYLKWTEKNEYNEYNEFRSVIYFFPMAKWFSKNTMLKSETVYVMVI